MAATPMPLFGRKTSHLRSLYRCALSILYEGDTVQLSLLSRPYYRNNVGAAPVSSVSAKSGRGSCGSRDSRKKKVGSLNDLGGEVIGNKGQDSQVIDN